VFVVVSSSVVDLPCHLSYCCTDGLPFRLSCICSFVCVQSGAFIRCSVFSYTVCVYFVWADAAVLSAGNA
jgi:hypothetical protein